MFTYFKTYYGEVILAKIQKLEKTMTKYSSYTNHLRFSLCCRCIKIVWKDLQLNRRMKTEQSKATLQSTGKLLLHEQIHINHVIHGELNNSIKQLKDKILEFVTTEELHLLEKMNQNLHKNTFDLTKNTYIKI